MSRPPRAALDDSGPQGSTAHVLLVEDDAAVRDATRLLLRVEGYRVTAVASLAEALEAVQSEGVPEVLLTDYYLRNGETGLAVLEALRARFAALPAVVMTGDPGALAPQASQDPLLRVAPKPLKRAPLLSAIEALLPR